MAIAAGASGETAAEDGNVKAKPAPEFPAGIGEVYTTLSKAVRTKDLPSFMKIFHLDFIYEAEDSTALDRGPWRRLWMQRFVESTHDRVTYELERIVEQGDGQAVLRVRRVDIVREGDSGARQLREV